ncbi:hypothetical protein Pan54_04790 [Rubinisphaera italica]|uniref:Uncharacterized protein n=1 Tax=Rubinisphaera italica TaxID=2527969 RepID=A0A5C5XAT1_9PLAN|nr:hypothetical protein Pan54_04790 [Rubinisphaera italica]
MVCRALLTTLQAGTAERVVAIPTGIAALLAVGIFTATAEDEVVIAATGSTIQTGGAVPLFEGDVSRVVVVRVECVGDDQKDGS